MEGQWSVSVSRLLELFRDALDALVPVAERARITYRAGESYDEWELIEEALYEAFVVSAIRNATPSTKFGTLRMARYGESIREMPGSAWISVRVLQGDSVSAKKFRRLEARDASFQWVICEAASPASTIAVPFDICQFGLVVSWADGAQTYLHELSIEI